MYTRPFAHNDIEQPPPPPPPSVGYTVHVLVCLLCTFIYPYDIVSIVCELLLIFNHWCCAYQICQYLQSCMDSQYSERLDYMWRHNIVIL